jgi:hypothetical protein
MTGETTEKRARTHSVAVHTVRTRDGGRKCLKYGRKLAILLTCTECLVWGDHPRGCTSPLCPLFQFRGLTMASQIQMGKKDDEK